MPKQVHVRGKGGYIVLAPSIHPNGVTYSWEVYRAQLAPQRAPGFVVELLRRAAQPIPRPRKRKETATGYTFTEDLASAVGYLKRLRPGRADDYDEWVQVCLPFLPFFAKGSFSLLSDSGKKGRLAKSTLVYH